MKRNIKLSITLLCSSLIALVSFIVYAAFSFSNDYSSDIEFDVLSSSI